jgi:hypothetical protein
MSLNVRSSPELKTMQALHMVAFRAPASTGNSALPYSSGAPFRTKSHVCFHIR